MANEEKITPKWDGKAIAELKGITSTQVWPLLADNFCALHKYLPALETSRAVDDEGGVINDVKPGVTRYCAFYETEETASALPAKADKNGTKWCHEKILFVDHVQKRLSYEMTKGTLGFGFYVAEWILMDMEDIGACKIEWSFKADPIEGWKLEDLCGFAESVLKVIAGEMEKEIQAAANVV